MYKNNLLPINSKGYKPFLRGGLLPDHCNFPPKTEKLFMVPSKKLRSRAQHMWLRLLPLFVLILLAAAAFILDLGQYLRIESLQANHEQLTEWVSSDRLLAILTFFSVYVGVVLMSVPGPIILTLVGGFLFGPFWGTIITVISATTGATIVFLCAKYSLGEAFRNRSGRLIQKMEFGFQRNALTYLFILRLVPLFPFGMVNIGAALFRVKLKIFVFATTFGIVPAVYIVSLFGAGLEEIVEAKDGLLLQKIFTPKIIASLIGLAALAATPVVYKSVMRKRSNKK